MGAVGTYTCTAIDREQWRVLNETEPHFQNLWKDEKDLTGTQIKPWHRGLGGFHLVVGEIKVGGFLTIDNLDMRSIKSAFPDSGISMDNAVFQWYPYADASKFYKLR